MLEKGLTLFNTWISKGKPMDTVTYNIIISSFCKEERLEDAFDLMTEMEGKNLEPDRYTYNAIVTGLTKAGRTEEAEKLALKFAEKGKQVKTQDTSPELGTSDMMYSEQISSLCTQGKYKDAMKLFQQAEQKGVSLNKYTYIKLMDGLLKRRKSISKAVR